ncbi:Retrovirus-related Pol Polyprotein [Phytophthora megakarya]|uniref:Retrovirus-related Pol Polyprotein n=1 Tax=Phytophthora megakarya TaxID=4795 RepID=A0A225WW42_9STRA|nr:Retrovirus-related Pol Polyprotein [Phytophthora megakarya]
MDFKVKMFSCYQGGEVLNHKLATFFRKHGIRLLTTNAYTPEENCLVEKLNGKLLSKVRAIREAANLPPCLWMTSYEKLGDRTPDMKDLKICGCVAYYHVPKEKQTNKLEMRAKPAIFLGMAESTLGYLLLDLKTGEMLQRRSVHFREDVAVGGDYVERLIGRQYYGKQTTVPSEIPFVLMPVTRVAISNSSSMGPPILAESETTNDDEVTNPPQEAGSLINDASDDDESDWKFIEELQTDENHGGACGATEHRVNPTTTFGRIVNRASQGAGTSGSAITRTQG